MTPVYDLLYESDAKLLGTPVCWWGPTAQTELSIDRWYPLSAETGAWQAGRACRPLHRCGARHIVGMLQDAFDYLGMDFTARVLATAIDLAAVAGDPAALDQATKLGRRLTRRAQRHHKPLS